MSDHKVEFSDRIVSIKAPWVIFHMQYIYILEENLMIGLNKVFFSNVSHLTLLENNMKMIFIRKIK